MKKITLGLLLIFAVLHTAVAEDKTTSNYGFFQHGERKTEINSATAEYSPFRDNQINVELRSSGKIAGTISLTFQKETKNIETIAFFGGSKFTSNGMGFSLNYSSNAKDYGTIVAVFALDDNRVTLRFRGNTTLGTEKVPFEWDFRIESLEIQKR